MFAVSFFSDVLTNILIIIIIVAVMLFKIWLKDFSFKIPNRITHKGKEETRQSVEELGYRHSKHYPYITNMTPLWVRLRLSTYRGNRKALAWRIKLLCILNIVGPQTADLLMEEYMINEGASSCPAPARSWVCAHCGAANTETALFCKDCGEYK